MTPSSPFLNSLDVSANTSQKQTTGYFTFPIKISERTSTPCATHLNTSFTVDSKDLPDEETVWALIELAGWEYKRMDFKGDLWQHRVKTNQGYEYMVPVTAGVPAYIDVWWVFTSLVEA